MTWGTGAAAKNVTLADDTSVNYGDGGGNDAVSVTGPIPITLDLGNGYDTFDVAAGSNATVNIGASNGDITISGDGNTVLVFGTVDPTFASAATPSKPTESYAESVVNNTQGNGMRDAGTVTADADTTDRYSLGLPAGKRHMRIFLKKVPARTSPMKIYPLSLTRTQVSGQ